MIISIAPVPGYPAEATQLSVDDGHVSLGVTANFQFTLLTANGAPVSAPARCDLTPEQYGNWTGDDVYVCRCVAENQGLTPL